MIKAKKTYEGQRRPYGDYEREWKVEADINKTSDQIVAWCRENLLDGRNIPSYSEHMSDYRTTGDLGGYFKGYYELRMGVRQEDANVHTYTFSHIIPYCD